MGWAGYPGFPTNPGLAEMYKADFISTVSRCAS